jgi:hypothetical protein
MTMMSLTKTRRWIDEHVFCPSFSVALSVMIIDVVSALYADLEICLIHAFEDV